MAKLKPLASCAIFGGFTGKRIGVRYFYDLPEARANSGKPYFRWSKAGRAALSSATTDEPSDALIQKGRE